MLCGDGVPADSDPYRTKAGYGALGGRGGMLAAVAMAAGAGGGGMTRGGRTDRVAGDSPFLPEALEANRGGTLTEAQRRSCQAQSRRVRWFGAGIGGLVIVLGLLFAVTRHSSSVMPLRPVVLIGCLLIGAIV